MLNSCMFRARCAISVILFTWLIMSCSLAAAGDEQDLLFTQITEQARILAARPYAPPSVQLPQVLTELNYDGYRDIRFQPAHALWRDERLFEVQFFHLGFLYREPVSIHVVEDGAV